MKFKTKNDYPLHFHSLHRLRKGRWEKKFIGENNNENEIESDHGIINVIISGKHHSRFDTSNSR